MATPCHTPMDFFPLLTCRLTLTRFAKGTTFSKDELKNQCDKSNVSWICFDFPNLRSTGFPPGFALPPKIVKSLHEDPPLEGNFCRYVKFLKLKL
jgi:hypothetical protein